MNSIIFDVAVIGAGVSGLTCAQQLKKAGDWCGGNQIEGALKSGIEATNWLQTQTSVLKNP
ncbi:hypothetical protein [Planktothrix mougeotii]|uniref:Uncharacterized protein n=1 Tax=Planktothrix mougeotii LEGE 06226 TaxID=1828728 RepID=A0ABR9UH33_9CYAN|nr:hypothetical protein [Planktothrix mougeotii]MBE9145765.1 hypothetical protein [Planktothrix mougeotii LEGE 06226]